MLFSCCCCYCSYWCCFCWRCAPLRQSMSVTVVACETTTKAGWMRDRDGNVCAAFVWVLMRHAPALISPDPPAQLCYYGPVAQLVGNVSLWWCRAKFLISTPDLRIVLARLSAPPPPLRSHPPSTLPTFRWLPVDHIETLCTYLSFISFVVSFWATWSHKIEININANSEQQVDFPLSGNAPICRG